MSSVATSAVRAHRSERLAIGPDHARHARRRRSPGTAAVSRLPARRSARSRVGTGRGGRVPSAGPEHGTLADASAIARQRPLLRRRGRLHRAAGCRSLTTNRTPFDVQCRDRWPDPRVRQASTLRPERASAARRRGRPTVTPLRTGKRRALAAGPPAGLDHPVNGQVAPVSVATGSAGRRGSGAAN